ncbi:hypothetical protein D3C72_1626140 [compost metagenome]
MRHGQGSGGHVVVAGEDGARVRCLRQQLARRVEPRTIRKVALRHPVRRHWQARFPHGVLEGLAAQQGGRVRRIAFDEADVAVAQRDQMARHGQRAFVVVDAHGRDAGRGACRGHGDGGDAHLVQLRQHGGRIAQRRRHEDAVHAGGHQAIDAGALAALVFAAFKQQLAAALAALVHGADEKFAEKSGAGVAV